MRDSVLCQPVDLAPVGARVRKWVLNDANNSNHHGIVNVQETLIYLHLSWRLSARDPIQFVGIFRFDLPGLLQHRYVRSEPKDSFGPEIRLRILRARDGSFYIQVNQDGTP